jgi:hypothetical protein
MDFRNGQAQGLILFFQPEGSLGWQSHAHTQLRNWRLFQKGMQIASTAESFCALNCEWLKSRPCCNLEPE